MRALVLLGLLGACHSGPTELVIEPIFKQELSEKIAPDREVIFARVDIPPHTKLPLHWHPGEEFAYLLEGEVTVHMDGKTRTISEAGTVGHIPLKAVHTASTGAKGARLLVVRIHEKGKPPRVLVEEPHDHD